MRTNSTPPLDLDALYGKDAQRPIQVKWGGKLHDFRLPSQYGPVEAMQLQELHNRFRSLNLLVVKPKKMTDAQFRRAQQKQMANIESVIDQVFAIVCPSLTKEQLPFAAKMNAFNFYTAEIARRAPKKEASGRRTGGRPTPA